MARNTHNTREARDCAAAAAAARQVLSEKKKWLVRDQWTRDGDGGD